MIRKPRDSEGRKKLSASDARKQLDRKCAEQGNCCHYCNAPLTREPGQPNTAVREHAKPQPAGCSKDDSDDNIVTVILRASRRLRLGVFPDGSVRLSRLARQRSVAIVATVTLLGALTIKLLSGIGRRELLSALGVARLADHYSTPFARAERASLIPLSMTA